MSSSNDWNTPPPLFEPALRMVSGGKFDTDPFANASSVVPARTQVHEASEADGFAARWGWNAWVNGPWSQQSKIVATCIEHALRGCEVFLVQPVTGASYLPSLLNAPARCYPHKRPQFWVDGAPPERRRNKHGKMIKPSSNTDVVLVYWGTRPWAFREVYRHLGEVRS